MMLIVIGIAVVVLANLSVFFYSHMNEQPINLAAPTSSVQSALLQKQEQKLEQQQQEISDIVKKLTDQQNIIDQIQRQQQLTDQQNNINQIQQRQQQIGSEFVQV